MDKEQLLKYIQYRYEDAMRAAVYEKLDFDAIKLIQHIFAEIIRDLKEM